MASRRTTRFAAAISVAALALSLTGGAVFAGEITGNGKSLKVEDSKWGTGLHARSFCAFSGQNDEYHQVSTEHPRVQSWGQIPKAMRDLFGPLGYLPGQACNPNIGPPPEPEG